MPTLPTSTYFLPIVIFQTRDKMNRKGVYRLPMKSRDTDWQDKRERSIGRLTLLIFRMAVPPLDWLAKI
jgi:hypothetical protein